MGNKKIFNMVVLGAYLKQKPIVELENVPPSSGGGTPSTLRGINESTTVNPIVDPFAELNLSDESF